MIYDVDYFISKFEAIPSEEIGVKSLSDKCAYWHCGMGAAFKATKEALAFGRLMKKFDKENDQPNAYVKGLHWGAIWLNDGEVDEYKQPTPKNRILAALYDIKKMLSKGQEVQEGDATKMSKDVEAGTKIIHHYHKVTVPESIETKELILS